jgi:hypothetical protein
VIAPQSDSVDRLKRQVSNPDHPLNCIQELHVVQSSGRGEGNFNSATLPVVSALSRRYEIKAAFAIGETLVEPAGIAADLLNLPSAGLRATKVARSKYLQRIYLRDFAPEHLIVHPKERAHAALAAPAGELVVKPSSRFSSSGVVAVAGRSKLEKIFSQYSDDEVLLVESRVRGPEFSVESIISHGEVLFSSVTQKRTSEKEGSFFVETAHTVVPARSQPDIHRQLITASARVANRLNVQTSFMHAEFRLTDAGPVLMEVAVRPPGDGIMMLYTLATGKRFDELLLPLYLGEQVTVPPVARYARQVYVHGQKGTLQDVSFTWPGLAASWIADTDLWPSIHTAAPDAPARLCAFAVLKSRGSLVQPMTDSHDRIATLLLDGPSIGSLDQLEASVLREIDVQVRPIGV